MAVPIALAATTVPASAEGTVRIGVTLRMLTENGQKYGRMVKDQFDAVNKAGGINGNKLEVFMLDDQCKPDIGVANVNRFIHQNKVHLVIGSTCSSVSMPIVPVTAKAMVPQIIPHSTNAKITKQGSAWVFRVSVSERFYSAVHGKWLAENVGKKVAYLYTTDSASISFADKYKEYMRRQYKVEPVYSAQMQETDLDFRSQLLKIKAAKPEVLAVGGQSDALARMVKQSIEVGIPKNVRRIGASSASNATVPPLAGDAAVGLTFAAAFSCADDRPIAKKFVKMVQDTYNVPCPDHDFSQAWDLAQIVKQTLARTKLTLTDASLAADRKAIRDGFIALPPYSGLGSGPISWCADSTPQCRDGNRTGILVEYTKGGKDYKMSVLARVSFDPGFGL
ncbi:MAG TPA: ABC transporter substrate-binding protein [Rhodospirillales bacterium]|jgi:branched-chain amino acid transport system substrate-binding protein|nr:ABC transporter substrate-binding protein [Rhodospirillales bacterium]